MILKSSGSSFPSIRKVTVPMERKVSFGRSMGIRLSYSSSIPYITVSIHTYTRNGLTLDELLPDRRKDLQAQTADRLFTMEVLSLFLHRMKIPENHDVIVIFNGKTFVA